MSTPASVSRVLLVADRTSAGPRRADEAKLRRFRLARLHLNGRQTGSGPHDHLRRSYD